MKASTFGGSLHASPKRKQRSVFDIFIKGLYTVLLVVAGLIVFFYVLLWFNYEHGYVDYGDNGILEEYPDKSAKMRLADIPPPRTGQRKEPSLREAFPLLKWPASVLKGSPEALREDISEQIETIHLRNTTQEEVDYYVTRGYIVVVDDMAKGHPMLGWSCETYAERWPNGLMRGEYPTPWRLNDAGEGYTVRLRATDIWIDTFRPAAWRKYTLPGCLRNPRCVEYVDEAATAAAYVWHVKDREPEELKQSVQVHWKPPYYMESEHATGTASHTFEMWFAPVKGGTFAHSDSYCFSTASMQLKGSKEWRIMNPGPRIDSHKDRIRFMDAEIYAAQREDQQFTPELRVTVPEGGGIIFPPYSYHETVTSNAECSAASTFTHDTPSATRYLRHYLPRLLNGHLGYEVACHRYWDDLALWTMRRGTGVPDAEGKAMPKASQEYFDKDSNEYSESKMYKVLPTTDKELMRIRYQKILDDVDTDKNGVIDGDELKAFVDNEYNIYVWDESKQETRRREFLAYWDLDDSGDITKEELWDGWEHWNINSAYAILTHMGGLWNPSTPRKPWW